jgi:hypothetical protein
MRQQDNEPLAKYYKRFTSCVDVAESQWGTLECQQRQQRMKRIRKGQSTNL